MKEVEKQTKIEISQQRDNLIEKFINAQFISGKSDKTLQNYRHTVEYLNSFLGKYSLNNEVYSSEILNTFFFQGLTLNKWGKYTLWTMYKNLNVFFKWCVEYKYLAVNPLELIKRPKMPEPSPKPLTEQEIITLLEAVKNINYGYKFTCLRNIAIILTFIYTGIRRTELLNLLMDDIDLKNNFLRIRHGKGDKYREIPIEQHILLPALLAYLKDRERLKKSSKWFFIGTFSGRGTHDCQLSVSALDRLFWKLSALTQARIHAHRLRSTFATLLLDNSGDIYTIKELMGHEDISTTCIYLKSTRKKKIQVINTLSFSQV